MAFIALGAIVWAVWPVEEAGVLQVTYTGISTNLPQLAWFNLTNDSKSSFACYSFVTGQQSSGEWAIISFAPWDMHWSQWPEGMRAEVGRINQNGQQFDGSKPLMIAGTGSTNFQTGVLSTNRWRVHIWYQVDSPGSFVVRNQRQLSDYALSHGFPRLSQWLLPKDRWKDAYGPEMLGNQPMPPVQK